MTSLCPVPMPTSRADTETGSVNQFTCRNPASGPFSVTKSLFALEHITWHLPVLFWLMGHPAW